MASTIAAITTGVGGVVTTADATGNLSLLSGTTTVVAVTSTGATVTGTLAVSGVTTLTGGLNAALPVLSGGTGVTTKTGTGAVVLGTSPTLTTPTFDSAQLTTVSGTAPLFMCRAWVNFNGTGVVAIRGSGNVSSITDNAAGDYTVNFTTAMTDANYNVCGSATGVGANPLDETVFAPKAGGTFSTSAVQIFTINPGSVGAGDPAYVSCSIFR